MVLPSSCMRMVLAEDDYATRRLLAHRLEQWGYEVVAVADGVRASEVLNGPDAPRLAVLDWHMPGLGGLDICRQLSQREEGPYVHSILITSATESERLPEALDSGANDFLTKPIVPNELRSRLGVGRRALGYHDQLAEKNRLLRVYATELEVLAATRARQLFHADRMATLGLLAAGIAHEVNNPAAFISGNVQTVSQFWPDIESVVKRHLDTLDDETRARVEFVLDEVPKALKSMHGGVKRISNIVKGLKAYSRQGASEKQACDMNLCVESALGLCAHDLKKREIQVERRLATGLPRVSADNQRMEQVLVNLAVNAAHAMQDGSRRVLSLVTDSDDQTVRVLVEDTGPGIPVDILDRIWHPFFTTKSAAEGTGLGLSICKDIIKEHDGELSVENRVEGGARFTLALPIMRREGT